MKKIFNTYNNPAEYIADTKEPNSVSLVKGDDTALDKVLFDGEYRCTEDTSKAKVGDIVCLDEDNRQIWYMSPSYYLKYKDKTSTGFYQCVGVVVITSDEDMDRSTRIVACNYMDYSKPEIGSADGLRMFWGDPSASVNGLNTIDKVTCVIPGTTTVAINSYGYVKFEFPYASLMQGDSDVYSMWEQKGSNYIPSPYDHSLYPLPNTANQRIAYGVSNTNKIIAAVNHSGDITNSSDVGHYPAAECCRSYKFNYTDKNSHCYLPTVIELLYLAARFETINASLILCGMNSLANKRFWSSTQYGSGYAFYLDTTAKCLIKGYKSDSCYVLGFIGISALDITPTGPSEPMQ